MRLALRSLATATALVCLARAASAQATPAKPLDCPADGFQGGFTKGCPQRQFANPADLVAMMGALPEKAYAAPRRLRRVLVLGRATTWVHTSIPLAAKMVEYLGDKTGAWMTTISYDASVVTAENLRNYDVVFLASTTGHFLDEPGDPAATEARKKALMDFVNGGKGLVGIHAASDSYRSDAPNPTGTWPAFNAAIGGFFKWHWFYPTLISVKVDDPKSPLTQMFSPRGHDIVDETYTFAQESFSRKRVHVLTSVNYARMGKEDKEKEPAVGRRTDGDYALSWIQRVGQGRVFYEAHGHDEKVYASRPFLLHMLAGIQYALGDLEADDSPSEK